MLSDIVTNLKSRGADNSNVGRDAIPAFHLYDITDDNVFGTQLLAFVVADDERILGG
jgi:hypothetical protein